MNRPMEDLLGQRIGEKAQYKIVKLLSKQTGRRTFLAKDEQTGQSVVIKIILFSPDFTWQDLKLFEREAETLQAIEHPAIPKYLESFEVEVAGGKGFALVQTYIEARSLQDWVDSGRTFSESELSAIAHSLLGILQYLHHRHPPIIHRDIKPSNILFQPTQHDSFNLFLVDFGSVQTVKTNGTMTVVGTYGYMPPEQFGGRAVPASDLYSLGATLIYLATGQHPADLTQDDMQIDFEQVSSLSTGFTRWIRRLTYPDMARRIRTVDSALESLNRLRNAERVISSHASAASHYPSSYPTADYRPVHSPSLPLSSTLADFEVSRSERSLEIRCRSSRIEEKSSSSEAERSANKETPLMFTMLAFAGFWIALVSAMMFNAAVLIFTMTIVVVIFGFCFPSLRSSALGNKQQRHQEETVLTLSASSSGHVNLTKTVLADSALSDPSLLQRSDTRVQSIVSASDFVTGAHLIMTLSPMPSSSKLSSQSDRTSALHRHQLHVVGTQPEIQWLHEHLCLWGKAPLR